MERIIKRYVMEDVLDVIDDEIDTYHRCQRDCETCKSWGDPNKYVCYQIALLHLKNRLVKEVCDVR